MTTTTISTSRHSSSDADRRRRTLTCADGSTIHVRWSCRSDGDFHRTDVVFEELERRRRGFVDLPWTMLDEHHGTVAVEVESPGQHDGAGGDIAVTSISGAVLGCWVGDCAPIVLAADDGRLATVHAGWRGLAAGVIDAAVTAFGGTPQWALLGPCIGPCCYEFGAGDLAAVAAGVGVAPDAITGLTRWATPALDVPAAVAAACGRSRISRFEVVGGCTGCGDDVFSHRARGERQRHVVAAWRQLGDQR
jgi:copper oxidase (laccase) domain-containing protein